MKILKDDYKDRVLKLGASADQLVEACRQVVKASYGVKKDDGYMKILSVDKEKVQIELTKEEVRLIKGGLGCGNIEIGETEFAQLEGKFENILDKMKD